MRPSITKITIIGLLVAAAPVVATAAEDTADRAQEPISAPPLGVKPALSQGLFTDLQVGTFFTLNTDSQRVGSPMSNAQPYVGVGLGYDINRNLVAGAGVAFGVSSGVCFDGDLAADVCRGARSFSLLLINAHFGYLHELAHQWYVGGKVLGGAALMTPGPSEGAADSSLFGYNAGVALSTEYHTHLEHFIVGLDMAATFVMGGNEVQFPGFAIYPRLKYVF